MAWFYAAASLLAAIGCGIWFLQRYYAKATLETALVRTGLGGRKVVLDGGCLALPIVHRLQRVSMAAISISATQSGNEGVLCRDQLRADVGMEFELRVEPSREGVSTAAQALGNRISRNGGAVHELLRGALVNAIQNAAAQRTMEDIHLNRNAFTQDVATEAGVQAANLGLRLISAALVSVDQTNLAQLDESNAFNAQGRRRLAELVAAQRKARVEIETATEIAVRESRLAQHQREIELKRAEREAEISQQEHLDKLEADAHSRSEQARATAVLASETVRIDGDQKAKAAQVASDEELRKVEMRALLALEEAKLTNEIELSRKRAEESVARAAEEEARAQLVLASENVLAQKERSAAEREGEIAWMRQEQDLARENARVQTDVDTVLAKTKAEATATATTASAEKARMEAEAEGRSALNKAENLLSESVIRMRLEERKLDRLPEIMAQMMKPVEKIESIRINQIGAPGPAAGSSDAVESAFGAAMEQILGMAVRLPAMKQMGAEIGLDFDPNLAGRTADYANRIKSKDKGQA